MNGTIWVNLVLPQHQFGCSLLQLRSHLLGQLDSYHPSSEQKQTKPSYPNQTSQWVVRAENIKYNASLAAPCGLNRVIATEFCRRLSWRPTTFWRQLSSVTTNVAPSFQNYPHPQTAASRLDLEGQSQCLGSFNSTKWDLAGRISRSTGHNQGFRGSNSKSAPWFRELLLSLNSDCGVFFIPDFSSQGHQHLLNSCITQLTSFCFSFCCPQPPPHPLF